MTQINNLYPAEHGLAPFDHLTLFLLYSRKKIMGRKELFDKNFHFQNYTKNMHKNMHQRFRKIFGQYHNPTYNKTISDKTLT